MTSQRRSPPRSVLKPLAVHGRPGQQAAVAVASAKERLLQETRMALRVSTARLSASKAKSSNSLSPPSTGSIYAVARRPTGGTAGDTGGGGGGSGAAAAAAMAAAAGTSSGKVQQPQPQPQGPRAATEFATDVVLESGGHRLRRRHSAETIQSSLINSGGNPFGRAPPPYSRVSQGAFSASNTTARSSSSEVGSNNADNQRSSAVGAGGSCVRHAVPPGGRGSSRGGGLFSAAGANDDDCASTLDLLSPGAFKGGFLSRVAAAAKSKTRARARAKSEDYSERGALEGPHVQSQQPQREQGEKQEPGREEEQDAAAVPATSLLSSSLSNLRLGEFGIPTVLLASLEADGITVATPLQAAVWAAGRGSSRADLLVHGRPGDETATAYCIPILERVLQRYPQPVLEDESQAVASAVGDATPPRVPPAAAPRTDESSGEALELQALVLTRTRDMAVNVAETLRRLGQGVPRLSVVTLIGGVPVDQSTAALSRGCNVAVGTPGRVRFLMNKGSLRTWSAGILVLDSADWLMATVFYEDVGWIASRFAKDKQVLAFSGADPAAIEKGLKELVDSPGMTSIGGNDSSAASTAVTLEQGEAVAAAALAVAGVVARGAVGVGAGVSAGCAPSSRRRGVSGDEWERSAAAPVGPPPSKRTPAGARDKVGFSVEESTAVGPEFAAAETAVATTSPIVVEPVYTGLAVAAPPGGAGNGGQIRTLAMMRAESARRAQGIGIDSSGSGGFGMMMRRDASVEAGHRLAGSSSLSSSSAAVTGAEVAGASAYFTGGVNPKGAGEVKGSTASTSSTASMSSTSSTLRSRMRSSRENELYVAWCGRMV